MAGEKEADSERHARANGIELTAAVLEQLATIQRELGMEDFEWADDARESTNVDQKQ